MVRDWLFTEKQLNETPSRKDGIDRSEEDQLRREGIKMIVEVGSALKLLELIYFFRFSFFN